MKPGHRLLIKTAILMPSAEKDEVTIVEVESQGYNKKQVGVVLSWWWLVVVCSSPDITNCSLQVKLPMVAMKAGVDSQKYIDLLIPGSPATIRMVQVTFWEEMWNGPCTKLAVLLL